MIKMIVLIIASAGVTEVDIKDYYTYEACVSDAQSFNQGEFYTKDYSLGPTFNFQCKVTE